MMNSFLKNKIALSLSLLTLIIGCSTYKNLDKENLSELYSLDNSLTAKYRVYHEDSLKTVVYYQFNFSEFTYIPKSDSSVFYAKYLLKYQLFTDFKATQIIDSASVIFIDSLNYNKNNSSLGYFEITVPKHAKYTLRIELQDLNAKSEIVTIIEIDKTNAQNRQNFLLIASDNLPEMNPSISKKTPYRVRHNNPEVKQLIVRHYGSFLKPAEPPMNDGEAKKTTKLKTDTTFVLNLENGLSDPVLFNKQGLYHLTIDSSSIGYSVMVFTEGYPWISTPMQMAAPMRYITSNQEYAELIKAEDKTKAVGELWLKLSGTQARADAMFQIYFNRVQEANMLFNSDREGWLTDRGMIFIVFGPPDKVFRNNYIETWVYGGLSGRNTISFNFYQGENPFTENDYRLDRTPSYINIWNSAIEFWRR